VQLGANDGECGVGQVGFRQVENAQVWEVTNNGETLVSEKIATIETQVFQQSQTRQGLNTVIGEGSLAEKSAAEVERFQSGLEFEQRGKMLVFRNAAVPEVEVDLGKSGVGIKDGFEMVEIIFTCEFTIVALDFRKGFFEVEFSRHYFFFLVSFSFFKNKTHFSIFLFIQSKNSSKRTNLILFFFRLFFHFQT
jgi:hypothetical protein